MLLPCHGLCLIRLFPLMLVCVVGINGCSSTQRFFSQSLDPARVEGSAAAELPYYASRPGMQVYSAPKRGSRVLATLTRHQKVLRSEVQRGYARIRTPDDRIQGWVDNGLLIWRLPAAKPSSTRTMAVKCPPQPAPPASLAEQVAPAEQVVPVEPAALAEQAARLEPTAPAAPVALAEPALPAERAAPAEPSPPAENSDGLQARPGAEVFDRF